MAETAGFSKLLFLRKSRYGILGVSYHVFRAAQFMTLLTIIGLTANFVADMNAHDVDSPSLLVGVLSLVSLAALYLVIIEILFLDQKIVFQWPLFIDAAILAGFIAISVVAGRPLSYLQCNKLGTMSDSASDFVSALAGIADKGSGELIYTAFIASTKKVCVEMKAIWGLIIASSVFFSFTLITGALLYFLTRRNPDFGNDKELGE